MYGAAAGGRAIGLDKKREGMVLITGGTFQMGSDEGGEFERPVHAVYLDDFWMDETPVTNEKFSRFIDESGYRTTAEQMGSAWGFDNGGYGQVAGLSWRRYATSERQQHPVVLVSWHDAEAYCQWADKRLPTEAEWEKAARGASNAALYPWGSATPDGTQSNFAEPPAELPPTRAVGQFAPNDFGLCDMVGNVWQWCGDWYSGTTYAAEAPRVNPRGPAAGAVRVRRGGSWNVIQPFRLRCTNRGAAPPDMRAPNIGFRCVAS